ALVVDAERLRVDEETEIGGRPDRELDQLAALARRRRDGVRGGGLLARRELLLVRLFPVALGVRSLGGAAGGEQDERQAGDGRCTHAARIISLEFLDAG